MARLDRQLKGKDSQTAEVIEGSTGGFVGSRTCKVRGTNVRACDYLGNEARSTRLSTGTNRNDKVMRGVLFTWENTRTEVDGGRTSMEKEKEGTIRGASDTYASY